MDVNEIVLASGVMRRGGWLKYGGVILTKTQT